MKTILFILCLLSITVNGQTPSFSKVFYDSALQDLYLRDVTTTLDSNIMILTNPPGLIKVNAEGGQLWTKGFEGELYVNNGNTLELKSISPTLDSCFMIGGFVVDSITNKRKGIVLKIDATGDTIWTGSIIDSLYNVAYQDVVSLDDTGAVLIGSATFSGLPSRTLVTRISSLGNVLWSKNITSPGGNVIEESKDSAFIIGGQFGLIKLDYSGNVLWANDYIGDNASSNYHYVNDIIPLDDGYMVYFGIDGSVVIAKVDFSGSIVWSFAYGLCPNPSSFGLKQALTKISTNNYVISSDCNQANFLTIDSVGNIDVLIEAKMFGGRAIEFKNEAYFFGEGPMLGVKTPVLYAPHIGMVKSDTANAFSCLYKTNDTIRYTKALNVNPFLDSSTNFGNSVYSSIHVLQSSIGERSGCVEFIGAIDENNAKLVSVYPNPSNGSFTVDKQANENMIIYFYNTLGELILTQDLQQDQNEIDLSNVVNGIYFYQVLSEQNKRSFGKVVISQ